MSTIPMPAARPTRQAWHRMPARIAGRILLALLVLLAALAIIGASYEVVMAAGDGRRYPPPGQLVDVGGHWLHIYCVGAGSPTVVLEGGKGGTSLEWSLVQPQLAEQTRVCVYDRAGTGWSEPGPMPRTPERVVAELHTLLEAAGEKGPYVLVAHSLGGRYVRLFAEQYPDEVAGLVLVDARSEYHDRHLPPEVRAVEAAMNKADPMDQVMRRLGVVRLFGAQVLTAGNPDYGQLAPDVRTAFIVQGVRPQSIAASQSEYAEMGQNDARLWTANLGDLPVRVLVSEQTSAMAPAWMAGQEDQAARSTNGVVRLVPGGHHLHLGNADAVAGAVREILDLAAR
jgi:pimeloyl-ACP methyl ester carboxylesterase